MSSCSQLQLPHNRDTRSRDEREIARARLCAFAHVALIVVTVVLTQAPATMAQAPARDSARTAAHQLPNVDGAQLDTLKAPTRIPVFNPSGRWSRDTHVGIGMGMGLLLGVAAFAGVVAQTSSARCKSQNGIPCGLGIELLVLPLMGGGAVAGGVIGALLPAANWEYVAVGSTSPPSSAP